MKAKEIHEMSTKELAVKLLDLKKELHGLRFSHTAGQLANPMQMTLVKKDIARVKTVMRARELSDAKVK